jgi:hypothetical protein
MSQYMQVFDWDNTTRQHLFFSQAWGVSDVHLPENCGVLDKLLPGDIILADRGFSIQETASLYCAEVKVPSFTKGN